MLFPLLCGRLKVNQTSVSSRVIEVIELKIKKKKTKLNSVACSSESGEVQMLISIVFNKGHSS
jgi:hypothetical protein